MVRSMYSGVAGMRAHQTRMDVIGNNISNVNTYGFKSSRVTFRDVYYQQVRGAAAGTSNRGGINPSQVGYGAKLGGIDVLHTQSTMSTTGNPLDVAITGEGYFQVQDADGNIFYTKAGMLDIDSAGNVIDSNGNFVLGVSGNPVGQAPGSSRIQVSIPAVSPTAAKSEDSINGIKFTISATNPTNEGNLTFNFYSDSTMPLGQHVKANVVSTGINISLNANEEFTSLEDLNNKINAAITTANGGKEHPAGKFSITAEPLSSISFPLKGSEIASRDFAVQKGSIGQSEDSLFRVKTVSDGFTGSGAAKYAVNFTPNGTDDSQDQFEITVTTATGTYTKTLTRAQMSGAGSAILEGTTAGGGYIELEFPSAATLEAQVAAGGGSWPYTKDAIADAQPSAASNSLGLSSKPFKLTGGTIGGAQSVKDLSGISIGADGVITGTHGVHGEMELGRIDLATFENPKGLAQSGNTYFTATPNSGAASLTQPGVGGTGALASSALEMSNVDLSQEFSDMITTQRGFQANSRLITVSDTMLEELINLKR